MKVIPFLKNHLSVILIAVLAAFCLLLPALIFLNPGLTYYAYAPYSFYILQPEEVTEEAIPEYAGIRRTYTFTLPEGSAASIGARLSFYLRHTTASAHIEDSDLYYDSSEWDTPHIGHTPGNYWVTIPVRPVYAGKTVTVTLTPIFDSVAREEPVFWFIGHEQLMTMVELPKDAFALTISVIAILAGLFLSLLAFVLPLESKNKLQIFLLGCTAITSGLWKVTELSSVMLMLDTLGWHKQIWYFGAAMYLLMLVLSLHFLVRSETEKPSRICKVCCYLLPGCAALFIILQIFNLLELHDVLIWYGIGAALLHLIVIISRWPSLSQLLWTLPFFLTLGADFAVYAISGDLHNSPFFLCWTILNLFIRGFGFVRNAILKERLLKVKEVQLRNTRIQAMMQQIRPHFIYNTLTSIYVLCREDPQQAMDAIQDFTTYLQANFTAISSTAPITFTDELRHTKAYLEVETLCYGDRLSIEYDTQYTAFRLPPLTLQPIVENAVKHGLGAGQKNESIVIRSYMQDGNALICVEDNGPGISPDSDGEDVHIGIKNVKERLTLMCGGTLTVQNLPSGGTHVTITIPRMD